MNKNEEIIRFVVANQAIEGIVMADDGIRVLKDCLEGKRSFDDTVQNVISAYTIQGAE